MALDKAALKQNLIDIFSKPNIENNIASVAEQMANAIDAYVKSAKIKYDSGLTAPNGAVTGTFNGSLQ